MPMDLRTERYGASLVVMPAGRIDDRMAPELAAALPAAMEAAEEMRVVIDMAGVAYIGSGGLRALLAAVDACAGRGASVALCHVRPSVRQMFGVAGLDQMVEIYTTRDEALAEERAPTDEDDAAPESSASADGSPADQEGVITPAAASDSPAGGQAPAP